MHRINPVLGVILIALWLPIVLALSTLLGCDTAGNGPPYPISAPAYTAATNILSAVAAAPVASLPYPWAPLIQAFAAAILALLAAWQGLTHKRVIELEQKLPQTKKDLSK
jgi:hypothetical protein